MRQNNHNPGFTLIELLVVISIISLLSSVILSSVSSARNQARIAANKRFDDQIRTSLVNCSGAFYNFEGSSGSEVREATGQDDLDGSITGNPNRVAGLDGLGQAMYFDGTNDLVDIPDKIIKQKKSLTVSGWVTIEQTSGHRFFFGNFPISFQLGIENGSDVFELEAETPSDSIRLSGSDFTTNRWHHVAGVYDRPDNEMRLYVDGSLEATESASGNLDVGDALIGSKHKTGGDSWGGKIDNLRVYNCPFEGASG